MITVCALKIATHLVDVIWALRIHAVHVQSPFNVHVFHTLPDQVVYVPIYGKAISIVCYLVPKCWT